MGRNEPGIMSADVDEKPRGFDGGHEEIVAEVVEVTTVSAGKAQRSLDRDGGIGFTIDVRDLGVHARIARLLEPPLHMRLGRNPGSWVVARGGGVSGAGHHGVVSDALASVSRMTRISTSE